MKLRNARSTGSSPGPAVDASGNQVIDPTENVKDTVAAYSKRQDDLREMESKHTRELLERDREHFRVMTETRANFYAELRESEAKRVNAIREVDISAGQRAAEVTEARALTLQSQVATTAEAMRGQMAATQQAWTEALSAAIKPLADAIQIIQQQQNIQAGQRVQVAEARDARGETRQNSNLGLQVIGALVAILLAYLAVTGKRPT